LSNAIRIAIDVMGGDYGPQVTVPAALQIASEVSAIELILVGDLAQIDSLLKSAPSGISHKVSTHAATQVVYMDEKPSSALRSKRDSSIHVAMQLVREGAAHAVVSAGNSGAVMAIGRHILKMLPGIDRPAMCAQIPDRHSHCYVLDLGANIDCSSEQLYQYAIMGSVVATAVDKIASPRVGLLNIGEEDIKGNEQIKLAARLLEENKRINYIGYIEADKIYEHAADVVVCDGFVGNTVLKASEGVARLIENKIKDIFSESLYGRVIGVFALPLLRKICTQIDPGKLNGASLLGLQGCVIKSHGGADLASFASAIRMAHAEAYKDVPQLINQQLAIMHH